MEPLGFRRGRGWSDICVLEKLRLKILLVSCQVMSLEGFSEGGFSASSLDTGNLLHET